MQRYYRLRPSRSLFLLVSSLCGAALATLWLLPLPTPGLLVSTGVVLCWSGYCLLLGANLRLGHSCVAFRLEYGDKIVLLLRNGRHLQSRISPDSLVTQYCVILNVIPDEQRGARKVVILADAMKAESFRQLRVALRWEEKGDQAAT